MVYRSEIDGLRALAVLSVILYHVDFYWFSGGYVGVDVFFVISGYLITSLIFQELSNNTFSILNFYERRARRILPALSFVLAGSLLLSWIYLSPYDLKLFCKSLVAVSTFTSNIFFYLTSGYFDVAANEKLLLHTWSLAIEEQFYLMFPLLLSFVWFLKRKTIIAVFLLLSTLSLSLAHILSTEMVNANFYLIFSRAWELIAGALLAIWPKKLQLEERVSFCLCLLGFLLILVPVFMFDSQTPFPSLYTLIPVMGTAIIIRFGQSENLVTAFLKAEPVVFIGLISYSLYLWHYPALALLHLKTIGEPDFNQVIAVLSVCSVLSIVSWKYIEKPFRDRNLISKRMVWIFAAFSTFFFFMAGAAGYLNNGFPSRFDSVSRAYTAESSPMRSSCHTSGKTYLPAAQACRYYGDNISWAALGDSHVAELSFALAERLQATNQGVVQLTFSDCPPAYTFDVNTKGCSEWLNEAVNYLIEDKAIENVVLGFRHVFYLYGNHAERYPHMPDLDPRRIFKGGFEGTQKDAENIYWQSYHSLIEKLLAGGKRVFILHPVPEIPLNIHRAMQPFSIFDSSPLINLQRSLPLSYYYKRNAFILQKHEELIFDDKLIAIRPTELLCDNDYCKAEVDGEIMYFDDDHLSVNGARVIAKLFSRYIEATPDSSY